MTHHLTSNKQKEAESKRKPPSEPICCTTTGRSAANSLAQTIGAASLSTREAQVKSTASAPHLRERRSQPRSAAGEPTPPSAPQAGILRSGPRATRFGAAALLSSLGCRSCCSQQRSSSTACRSRACERASLLFTSCLLQIFCLLFFRRGGEGGGVRTKGGSGRSGARRASSHGAPVDRAGRRQPCPNGAPLENFGRVARREEAAGASRWGLGSENRPSRRWALNTGRPAPGI